MAQARLPIVKIAINASSVAWRGQRAVTTVSDRRASHDAERIT